MKNKLIKNFRWLIRLLSGILILFILFMFIGETFFPPESLNSNPPNTDAIAQLLVFGIVMIGLAIAWKLELTRGLVALSAYALLVIINTNALQFPLLLFYPVTALLFIVLWAVSRNVIE
jgi:hypothetical protein